MRTTVIVPPVMLVQMFGVPEMVKLPTKKGGDHETIFDAHGKRFYCRKISGSEYMLTCPMATPRARFGNAKEMAEDIGRALETGSLPQSASSVA